uniref:Replication protein A OB domain-containing protein n=1 Tax=Chenopodium quinoa TaxID=63459 RepID=A0A803M656_CHEQI
MMRVTLFGDQIKAYDEAIAYNGEYEISNATVRSIDDQYRTTHDQPPYQLHFNHRTIVQPVCTETGYVVPQYQSIASIPKLEVADERYDVLGVILFVEEAARQISSKYNIDSYVREIVITDQTHNQTLTISAWNDLSGTASDALNFWAEKFTVVGFTALKHNPRRAFALSTIMSTRIIHNPKGDRANMLREWVVAQKQLLQDRQARVLQIRDSTQEPSMKTIEELKEKKVALNVGTNAEYRKEGNLHVSFVTIKIVFRLRGIVITDEGERAVKDSTILTAELVRTPKLSTAEWTDLCRTRMSGTKHSPVTPTPIGDTKSSLDHHKSTAAKKLRFTTPEKTESKNDEVAEKNTEE